MRKTWFAAFALLPLWACSSDSTQPPAATSVTITPGSTISFDAVGASQVVHAAVADQHGRAMRNAALSWSSSSPAVFVASMGGDSAQVTALANGSATVTATSASASGSVEVNVAQAGAAVAKSGGDLQIAPVAVPLPVPLRVTVTDRLGKPAAGVTVAFAAAQGNGSVSPAAVTTGADGTATASWTLGTKAVVDQFATATVAGLPTVTFSATGTAGPPATLTLVGGNNQVAPVGMLLTYQPVVYVADAYANSVMGARLTYAVTGGGGQLTRTTAATYVNGAATIDWTMGPTPAVNTMQVTVDGTSIPPVVVTATGKLYVSVTAASPTLQAVMAGTSAPLTPTVVVTDPAGKPLAGLPVTFSIPSGGGSITGANATTDASGRASPGSWIPGSDPGTYRVSATVADAIIKGAPAEFTAVPCNGGGGSGYAITLCSGSPMTDSQAAAFRDAAARWQGLVTGDLPDVPGTIDAGTCGNGTPAVGFKVDDLLIFASVQPIDGANGILGYAGWCMRRDGGLPVLGIMAFDAADVAGLESSGQFAQVILHEMGHVLGVGTLWSQYGYLQDASASWQQLDTWYSGPGGLAAFDAIGGGVYAGQKVPVENGGGAGTMNSHWRESVLRTELMTGYLDPGVTPLSLLTVRSLEDLGYAVNRAGADAFSLAGPLMGRAPAARALRLGNDTYRGPRSRIDRRGRVTPIR